MSKATEYRLENQRIKLGLATIADMLYAANADNDRCEKFVRAVNNFDDLLASLKEAREWMPNFPPGGLAHAVCERMDAAIAKAEAKT